MQNPQMARIKPTEQISVSAPAFRALKRGRPRRGSSPITSSSCSCTSSQKIGTGGRSGAIRRRARVAQATTGSASTRSVSKPIAPSRAGRAPHRDLEMDRRGCSTPRGDTP